jgi:hypothetical protein
MNDDHFHANAFGFRVKIADKAMLKYGLAQGANILNADGIASF